MRAGCESLWERLSTDWEKKTRLEFAVYPTEQQPIDGAPGASTQ
jgi:hypothetical protein